MASPTAGSHREPAAGELSRSYGHFRSAHAFDVVCKGRELTESQDQRREGEQRALRARARMHFSGMREIFKLRRCASGCTSLCRAVEINTCAVGALLGAASVACAVESRLSSAACRLRALPGLARSSAADAVAVVSAARADLGPAERATTSCCLWRSLVVSVAAASCFSAASARVVSAAMVCTLALAFAPPQRLQASSEICGTSDSRL